MNKLNRTRLALIIVLVLCMLVPTVSARRKTHVKIFTVPDFDDFVQYDNSVVLKNGHVKVDQCIKFFWIAEDNTVLGYALQYVTGVNKGDQAMLHGYGVFYSTLEGKPGTITYKIGNVWQPNDPENPFDDVYWGAHLKICGGTDYFSDLNGQGELNFEEFAFEFYLNYNPWE
jgi:hypothetical protein